MIYLDTRFLRIGSPNPEGVDCRQDVKLPPCAHNIIINAFERKEPNLQEDFASQASVSNAHPGFPFNSGCLSSNCPRVDEELQDLHDVHITGFVPHLHIHDCLESPYCCSLIHHSGWGKHEMLSNALRI